MSKLDDPRARELLAQTRLTAGQVRDCRRDLTAFMERYLPRFYRQEQRNHATLIIRGLLSGLERKTAEPDREDKPGGDISGATPRPATLRTSPSRPPASPPFRGCTPAGAVVTRLSSTPVSRLH